jgi:hypothetical protein
MEAKNNAPSNSYIYDVTWLRIKLRETVIYEGLVGDFSGN